jgi:hypothetical protein
MLDKLGKIRIQTSNLVEVTNRILSTIIAVRYSNNTMMME